MLKKWKFDGSAYGYNVWRREDKDGRPYYNVTKGDKPPKSASGYYDRKALLERKRSNLFERRGMR